MQLYRYMVARSCQEAPCNCVCVKVSYRYVTVTSSVVSCKVHPRTGHEGPEGE
jgi:hypothetical protein